METTDHYRELIERILTEDTVVPYANGEIGFELVFDRERDRYLLMLVGLDHRRYRVHGALIHVDLIDGKAWIQRDGTEYGIARELRDAGMPPEDIVLAWRADGPVPATEALAA